MCEVALCRSGVITAVKLITCKVVASLMAFGLPAYSGGTICHGLVSISIRLGTDEEVVGLQVPWH